MFDSDRPASESSPYNSENSEPRFKATLTFEGNAYEVKAAIFGPTEELGRKDETISILNQKIEELKNESYDRFSDVRREQLRADRAEDDAREARRNHQVVLNREYALQSRLNNISETRDLESRKFHTEIERLRSALKTFAGGEEEANRVLEEIPAPILALIESESKPTVERHESPGLSTEAHEVFDSMTPRQFANLIRGFALVLGYATKNNYPEKIQAIKLIREHLSCRLKAAKDLYEYQQ